MKELLALAFQHFDDGKLKEAEQLYRQCLSEVVHHEDEKESLHGLGFTLAMKGTFKEAVDCYEKLLTMAESEGNFVDEAIALHQIGMVYRIEMNFTKSLEFFRREKELREKKLPDHHVGFSANAYEFGLIALLEKRMDESESHFEEALVQGEIAEDLICIACALRGKGQYFEVLGNRENAKNSFLLSIEAFEKAGDSRGAVQVREMLAGY